MSSGFRVAIVRRHFTTKLPKVPWALRQKKSPVVLKPLTGFDRAMFRSQIPEGFKFAYSSLISALGSHDYASLQEFLEGRLYHKVEIQLKALESQGFRMQVVNPEENVVVEPEIHNVGMHVGVHLQRIKNPPKEDFLQIVNLEQFKPMIATMNFQKIIPGKDLPVDRFLAEDLSSHWIYVCPSGPAKAVIAADVMYRGNNPLTVVREDKDEVYTGRVEEVHVIRFESTVIDFNSEQNSMGMHFAKILPKLLSGKINLLESQWEIADIDNVMEGNPFVVSKKELAR